MIDHALPPFADGGRDARARLLAAVSEDDIAQGMSDLLEQAFDRTSKSTHTKPVLIRDGVSYEQEGLRRPTSSS